MTQQPSFTGHIRKGMKPKHSKYICTFKFTAAYARYEDDVNIFDR